MTNNLSVQNELNDFLLYTIADGKVKIEAILLNESVWRSK